MENENENENKDKKDFDFIFYCCILESTQQKAMEGKMIRTSLNQPILDTDYEEQSRQTRCSCKAKLEDPIYFLDDDGVEELFCWSCAVMLMEQFSEDIAEYVRTNEGKNIAAKRRFVIDVLEGI